MSPSIFYHVQLPNSAVVLMKNILILLKSHCQTIFWRIEKYPMFKLNLVQPSSAQSSEDNIGQSHRNFWIVDIFIGSPFNSCCCREKDTHSEFVHLFAKVRQPEQDVKYLHTKLIGIVVDYFCCFILPFF